MIGIDFIALSSVVLDGLKVQQTVDRLCARFVVGQIHSSLEFRSPFGDGDSQENVENHCGEDDHAEDPVEGGNEENNCDEDIDDGWGDGEENVVQQIVDAVSSAIHHAQNFTGFSAQMPAETQRVQVTEKLDFNSAGCVLLDSDPQEAASIVQKPHGSSAAALKELESNVDENPVPAEVVRDGKRIDDFLVVDWHIKIDNAAEKQHHEAQNYTQLKHEVSLRPKEWHQSSQFLPSIAESRAVFLKEKKKEKKN